MILVRPSPGTKNMRCAPELLDGICELTLEAREPGRDPRPVLGARGRAGPAGEDPEGIVVEVWDFFEREPEGVDALAQ
jgi:hypothetical protein